jgi:hypothetical protein
VVGIKGIFLFASSSIILPCSLSRSALREILFYAHQLNVCAEGDSSKVRSSRRREV